MCPHFLSFTARPLRISGAKSERFLSPRRDPPPVITQISARLLGLKEKDDHGTSLVVQWLRLHASTAGDMGSIPGQGTKILHYMQCGQKKKDKDDQLKPPHLLLWRPTPVFLPGEFHGRGSWWAIVHEVTKSRTQLSNFPIHYYLKFLLGFLVAQLVKNLPAMRKTWV